jgi:putative ABC transport system permease protein
VPDDLQAWLPFPRDITLSARGQQYLRVVGRMRPGVTVAQARAEIDGIAARSSREFTEYGRAGRVFTTVGLQEDDVREMRPMLLALLAGVAVLLVIAGVNVAGLLLARAFSRRKEIAVRVALGAGRGSLLRQCLAEGIVLAGLGALAGLLLARLGLAALLAARPESLARIGAARIDPAVLAFTAGTALLWGLLLSLAPRAEAWRADLRAALQRDGRGSGAALHQRARATLVAVQIALGVVLLVGAGLLARTFQRLQRVDPGFHADGVLSFRLALPGARYSSPAAINAFSRALEAELGALPGVAATGAVSHLPYDHLPNWGGPYLTRPGQDDSTAPEADYRAVTPGFFATVGARVVEGRGFLESDDEKGRPVVVVDERLARRAFSGESAVGKALAVDPYSDGHPTTWATVVGVVRHLRHRRLVEEVREQVYFPQRQILRNPMAYVLRASGDDPAALAAPLRAVVARLDPQLPVYEVRPLADYVVAARGAQRFTLLLAGAFAGVAVTLAAVGLYGVIAYAVARRRREFGIRLALGARPGQVQALVVREGLRVAAVGLALGMPTAALGARALRAQLFGVGPRDPASYAGALALLALAAVLASWIAARRATAASPLEVLRSE